MKEVKVYKCIKQIPFNDKYKVGKEYSNEDVPFISDDLSKWPEYFEEVKEMYVNVYDKDSILVIGAEYVHTSLNIAKTSSNNKGNLIGTYKLVKV